MKGLQQCYQDLVSPYFSQFIYGSVSFPCSNPVVKELFLFFRQIPWAWLSLVQKRTHAHSLYPSWPGECGILIGQAQVICSSLDLEVEPREGCGLRVGKRVGAQKKSGMPYQKGGMDIGSQSTLATIHPVWSSLSVPSYSWRQMEVTKIPLKAISILNGASQWWSKGIQFIATDTHLDILLSFSSHSQYLACPMMS